MTIQRLREIAEYHAGISAKEAAAETRLLRAGHVNKAIAHGIASDEHAKITRELRELADAFSTLTPLLTSQK
jgi:hypothetical protein